MPPVSMPAPSAPPSQAIALFEGRPFFEKALRYGVQHGILDAAKLASIRAEAPKGMVQIARYFGSEYLRPQLEQAKERLVNLVSLYLEHSCEGDVRRAAESLREHSFLSRSKGGSDMLKTLIAMPQVSHFGLHEHGGFRDEHIPLLAQWTHKTLADYQAEWAKRQEVAQCMDAALWLAAQLGMDEDALHEAHPDAEAVIRTALLALALKRTEMPDWPWLEKMLRAVLKKMQGSARALSIPVPAALPAALRPVVLRVRDSLLQDLATLQQQDQPLRKLLHQSPSFMGRYFWREDVLAEVDDYVRSVSATWDKATGGHGDDSSLLTLWLCLAAGGRAKTLLTEKSAAALVRKIRKHGWQPDAARDFIRSHAPHAQQGDYLALWKNFVEESSATLRSDRDYALHDALSLLRRECNVAQ